MSLEDKDYISIFDDIDKEDLAKVGGVSLLGYGIAHGAKYTPLSGAIARQARKGSTIIKDYYKKAITAKEKRKKFFHHFTSNWDESIDKFIKKYPEAFPKDVSSSRGYLPITEPQKRNMVLQFMHQEGAKTPAELLHIAERDIISQKWAAGLTDKPYGLSKTKRKYSHEKLKTEMINYTGGLDYDADKLKKHGLTKPVSTDVKTIFRGHGGAMRAWGVHPDAKVSVSNITNINSDKRSVTMAAKSDHMFQMGEAVAKSNANINNSEEVKAVAKNRLEKMGVKLRGSDRLHPKAGSHLEELEKFMKNYRVTKDGKLAVNFSPMKMPHYLSGGMNADVVFSKSKKGKLHYDILTSDKYDILDKKFELLQRKHHFNVSQSSSKKTSKRSYLRGGVRRRFLRAIKLKDYKTAAKLAARIGIKTGAFIGRKALLKI